MKINLDMFYTIKEVAQLMRVHPNTLRYRARHGEFINHVVFGRKHLYEKNMVHEYVERIINKCNNNNINPKDF